MGFLTLFFIFILFGLLICLFFGEAALLVYGVLFVLIYFCIGEYKSSKTPKGRKRIRRQYEKEKKIEEYWGTIDYWENK